MLHTFFFFLTIGIQRLGYGKSALNIYPNLSHLGVVGRVTIFKKKNLNPLFKFS